MVEPEGRKGGLMLLWNQSIKVEVLNYSQWPVSVWVKNVKGSEKWLLTSIYG